MAALSEWWWAYVLVGLACGTFGATFGVGSGITYDSSAESEYRECLLKAQFLSQSFTAGL